MTPPVDEGTVIATYRITSDFKVDYGADPAVTRAIDVLRPLEQNPGAVIGEWMSTAAPGLEAEVAAVVASAVEESPYLAETWRLDALTYDMGYRTFWLNQDLEIVEQDGKRTLRDEVIGPTVWSRQVSDTGAVSSWTISAPMSSSVIANEIPFRFEGNMLIVDHHRVQIPLAEIMKVLYPGSDVGFALTLFIDCSIIASRVTQQVPVNAADITDACTAGAQAIGDEFEAAVDAITSRIELSMSAAIAVTDSDGDGMPDKVEGGRWSGSFKSPSVDDSPFGDATIKQRSL